MHVNSVIAAEIPVPDEVQSMHELARLPWQAGYLAAISGAPREPEVRKIESPVGKEIFRLGYKAGALWPG